MNESIKQLAEEAGFCFWADESWKPAGAEIDWSSNYDKEFNKFVSMLKEACYAIVMKEHNTYLGEGYESLGYYHRGRVDSAAIIAERIEELFEGIDYERY